jgi:NAD+ synthase (glutamine-hydrolysing)
VWWWDFPEYAGSQIFNSAALIEAGTVRATHRKSCLPNYKVFDEKRYFKSGAQPTVVEFRGFRVGILVCEDIWEPEPAQLGALGRRGNVRGAECLAVRAAQAGQPRRHRAPLRARPAIAGGVREHARRAGRAGVRRQFLRHGCRWHGGDACTSVRGGLYPVEFERVDGIARPVPGSVAPALSDAESVYRALVLGVRDYVSKHGFPGVVMGLSGGIDSALTLAIAVDALGKDRIHAVMMPSPYTSQMSLDDAREQAAGLGVKYSTLPIGEMMKATEATLAGNSPGAHRMPPKRTSSRAAACCC